MRTIETIAELGKIKEGCVLSIGNFDGVHLGHQKIISTAKQIARSNSADLIAMTFEPHPVAVLHPENTPAVLTPLELKIHLLQDSGVDSLIVLKDTRALLSLSAKEFVDEFLVKQLKPAVVVEGDDFNFGAGRDGNIHTLQNLGKEKGFDVRVIEPQKVKLTAGQSVRVSSTMIRKTLEYGKVDDAAVALGRFYRLTGKIVPGKGVGKKLGYPTLNMKKPGQIIPAEGVYAGFVELADTLEQVCKSQKRIDAVFSIGRTKTFGADNPLNIEAHILTERLPAATARWFAMDFVRFIRDQKKFKTETDLTDQIKNDCEDARKILTTEVDNAKK